MGVERKLKRTQMKQNRLSKTGGRVYVNTVNGMIMIGTCKCGQPLYHYSKSDRENIFNAYCLSGCGTVQDVRFPFNGTKFFTDNELKTPIEIVFHVQHDLNKIDYTEDDVQAIAISSAVEVNNAK